jgi:hypothetical protein
MATGAYRALAADADKITDAAMEPVDLSAPPWAGLDVQLHVEMGQLVWLDNQLVPDASQITNFEYSFDEVLGVRERYTGTILLGTGKAWRR